LRPESVTLIAMNAHAATAALTLLLCALPMGCASSNTQAVGPPVFYPAPPAEPRLQFLARYSSEDDVAVTGGFRAFVVGEVKRLEIGRAHGVAWHAGRIYICDAGQKRIVVVDPVARTMNQMDPGGQSAFKKPIEIAISEDGFKYVTDTEHRRVAVFDASDRYQGAFGDPASWKPVGIATTNDRLYVTDTANHQLVVLDRGTGAEQMRIGRKGAGTGTFHFPTAVTVAPSGDLYVSDTFNTRVQRFLPDGSFVRSYGTIGKSPGSFVRPRGVAVDRAGRVYVADAAFENVQILDDDGQLMLFFGAPGEHRGAMNMPAAVEISYDAVPAFASHVAAGRSLEYVLFVSNHTGPNSVSAYGFLRAE